MNKTPVVKTGDYKKMLIEVRKTYHKEVPKKEEKKALGKEIIKWIFGN